MTSSISHEIKHRKTASDVFYTPEPLAKIHIDIVNKLYKTRHGKASEPLWFDPCCGEGVYLDNFPSEKYAGIDINSGADFFGDDWIPKDFKPDIICSNPPYSVINKWLERTVEFKPDIISYLLAGHAITPARLELMENWGYILEDITMVKVKNWYGMTNMATWVKNISCYNSKSVIKFNRTVFK